MLPEEIFRIALLSLLMGFSAMAALQTLDVWRRRRAVVQGKQPRPLTTLQRFALVLGAAGALALVSSVVFRAAIDRNGFLVGRDLQTVRVPPGLELVDVADGPEVAGGAVVARFRAALASQGIFEVRSTVAGAVVYRSPSPATAYGSEPLLVIAPPDGLRARIRLPTREVEDLRAAGVVALDLIGPRFMERRFSGRLVEAHPIEGDPSWSAVEIAGQPHPDGVREMVIAGTTPEPELDAAVKVELDWSPSVLELPLFDTGLGLALVGATLFLASVAFRRRTQENPT